MDRLRVTQIIPDFGLGGIQKAGCVLAAGLAELGCETSVLGLGDGPRYDASASPHMICDNEPAVADWALNSQPNVVHIHARDYCDGLIQCLRAACPRALIVSTPVFGRPPKNRALLQQTRTCTVGVYTFYRLRRWLGWSAKKTIERGIGYVPLTPFSPLEPRSQNKSDLDRKAKGQARQTLGLEGGGLVVGRIGRATVGKWHPQSEVLVNRLLEARPSIRWLSVGMPDTCGAQNLRNHWQNRFINLPETSDPAQLSRVIQSLDLQVFFSRHGECFASSIAEAAGLGVPTIALATPFHDNGQCEQVIDGTTGHLVSSIPQAVDRVCVLHDSPTDLVKLQLRTASHALTRWHYHRVAEDILALYGLWRGVTAGQALPSYVETMLAEENAFARTYRRRLVELNTTGVLSRLAMAIGLAAYENWTVFKTGRALKAFAAKATLPRYAL
jgi:hypothetical protein